MRLEENQHLFLEQSWRVKMNKSPEAIRADLDLLFSKQQTTIELIEEYMDPMALQEILIEICSQEFQHPDFSDKKKLEQLDPDIVKAEQEQIDQYNEFKGLLLQLLKEGYHFNLLSFIESNEKIDNILNMQRSRNSNIDLASDFQLVNEKISGAFSWRYTLYFFGEIINKVLFRKLSKAEKLNDCGYKLAEKGNYSKAINYYKTAIEKSPMFQLTWNNLGIALANIGKFDSAIECFNFIIEDIDNNYKKAWYNKAVILGMTGRLKDALDCCDVALRIDPFYNDAINLKSEIINTQKNSSQLKKDKIPSVVFLGTERSLQEGLNNSFINSNLTVSFINIEEGELKIKPFNKYDEEIDNKTLTENELLQHGHLHIKKQKYKKALSFYDLALQKNPNSLEALIGEANSYHLLDKYDDALRLYNKILEIDNKNISILNAKSSILFKKDRFEDVIKFTDLILEIDPQNVNALIRKSGALINMGKPIEALAIAEKAIRLDSKRAMAWQNKGAALGLIEKYQKAIRCFEKAIQIDPLCEVAKCNIKSIQANIKNKQ